ncbi:MAG: hypothetical protein HGB15_05785 [Chlorobaculum sp.]|nr:hypothetical protein [Chlorobaculum sp.]
MTSDPHLIFAEVSLDIKLGAFEPALDKLSGMERWLPESYIFHLLSARATLGLRRYEEAVVHLGHCCRIAPANQVAWRELIEVKTLQSQAPKPERKPAIDEVAVEFEQLSKALAGFTPPRATECFDPTPLVEQKQPFPDDASIAVPTETLANLFIDQKAYKKAIRVYTSLIQLNPSKADHYRNCIDQVLEKL